MFTSSWCLWTCWETVFLSRRSRGRSCWGLYPLCPHLTGPSRSNSASACKSWSPQLQDTEGWVNTRAQFTLHCHTMSIREAFNNKTKYFVLWQYDWESLPPPSFICQKKMFTFLKASHILPDCCLVSAVGEHSRGHKSREENKLVYFQHLKFVVWTLFNLTSLNQLICYEQVSVFICYQV